MTEEVITLEAAIREKAGKGAARADRKEGRLPVVVYGNKKPALSLTVSANEVLRLLNKGGFKKADIHIKVGNDTHKVKVQALQVHPTLPKPMHIDFLRTA